MYWLTADPGVSYWDCPEYVVVASRLEVGHSPGNPVWALAMRALTAPFPLEANAKVINMASGLFMAGAAFFVCRIIFALLTWIVRYGQKRDSHIAAKIGGVSIALCSAGGALCFAFCDSAWFSAVEAEVYAMSAFFTGLMMWLMILWAKASDKARQNRLLILLAYLTGLTLGIHQLNLLLIPALALIWVFRRRPERGQTLKAWFAAGIGMAIVGIILLVMMPGVLKAVAWCELFAVNTLHMPFFSGVIGYAAISLVLFTTFIWAADKWLRPWVSTTLWCTAMVWLGYMAFGMILIRGYASPPVNECAPTDIFALQRYINREQYGSKPLFYGPTPFSKPLLAEDTQPGGAFPKYTRYALVKGAPRYVESMADARIHFRSGFQTPADSAFNNQALKDASETFLFADYAYSRATSPELNMWLPRITSSAPAMLEGYEDWAAMNPDNMEEVEISLVVDSLGHPNGKIGLDGERHNGTAKRPTYLQNLRYLLGYQIGYMYFRYLLWNFMGRQNDIPATGEIDHGNFITGIPPIDNAMLGPQDLMPDDAGKNNTGHNVYFGIPFLLGLAGIAWMLRRGRKGWRELAAVAMMFFMTGIAIVLYLNQTPGEPRERDYSFIGSYMAFAIWIGAGMMAIRWLIAPLKTPRFANQLSFALTAIAALGTPALMLAQNYGDHDRSGRFETEKFVTQLLETIPDGIIFTQGDNYTFPLWYADEMNPGRFGHTIVDVSYLSMPQYVVNLMKQGEKGVKFTAKPGDIAYGAYAFTGVAADADTVPVPLIEALHELYAQRYGSPLFHHSRVSIPGKSLNDTIVLDLRKVAGSSLIPFKSLMLLDIIATNLEQSNPRPLHFLTHLPTSFYSPVKGATTSNAFAETYAPWLGEEVNLRRIKRQAEDLCRDTLPPAPDYIDPVVAGQHRRQRGAVTRLGRLLLDAGLITDALQCAWHSTSLKSKYGVRFGSYILADTAWHEGLELAKLLIDVADSLQRNDSNSKVPDASRQLARRVLEEMNDEGREWLKYRLALPANRRHALSSNSRLKISKLTEIDSLLNIISLTEKDLSK